MEVFDERAEAFFAFAESIDGAALFGDVPDDDEGAAATIEIEERAGKLADTQLAGFCPEGEFDVANFRALLKLGKHLGAARGFGPEIEFERSLAEDFGAGISGEAGEAVVDVEVGAVGEDVDGKAVGAGAKGGGEQVLGVGEGVLGCEKLFGDAALLSIGEDESDRGADKRSDNGEPGEGDLIAGNGAPHEQN